MIFITTGTQLPFDRLILAMDEIANELPGTKLVAQALRCRCVTKNIEILEFVSPERFNEYLQAADLVISHAGIGSIVSVGRLEKPLIIFPRLAKLREHRNDHQLATCRQLANIAPFNIAYNEIQLREQVLSFYDGNLPPTPALPDAASTQLLSSIRDFMKA
jgi:UDP-N-acetylglucosamine transferase subunit ALG13